MKVLLVTFPNDLGSRTIETNLIRFVSMFSDLKVFRFAAQDIDRIDSRIDNRRNLRRRFQDMYRLRAEVKKSIADGRKILFYNISPALFAYGAWKGGEAYITLDWARRLLADKSVPDRDPLSPIHRRILHACTKVLPMTDAMAECLRTDYDLPPEKIHRVPSLFDVAHFDPGEIQMKGGVKVLFVGGDLVRKGGDLLCKAFIEKLSQKCTLTMVTNAELPNAAGLRHVRNVRYGTPEHLELMRSHDLFVLPTREDAGPQVIGEAAAAGMAVFTTKHALGAPHVVKDSINGAIADSPETCIECLEHILEKPLSIPRMRRASLDLMRRDFAPPVISAAYAEGMGGSFSTVA